MIGKDYRPLTTLEAKSSNVSNIDYGNNPNWVQARQYEDSLRQVFVEITNEDGSAFDLTGANIIFEGILPDNEHKIIDNSHAVFYEDPTSGKFRFDLPAPAFAVAGQYKQAFFRVTKGYKNLATLEFKFEVLADWVISGLQPRDYLSPLEEFYEEIKNAQTKDLNDLKKLVDDKIAEITNLMTTLNQTSSAVLSDLTTVKASLEALKDKIEQEGLFTKSEAEAFKSQVVSEIEEIIKSFNDSLSSLGSDNSFSKNIELQKLTPESQKNFASFVKSIEHSEEILNLAVITDAHVEPGEWYSRNGLAHVKLFGEASKQAKVDAVISLGDNIDGSYGLMDSLVYRTSKAREILKREQRLYIETLSGSKGNSTPLFILKGNHDTGALKSNDSTPQTSLYSEEVDALYSTNGAYGEVRNGSSSYFYKDFNDKKIRLICLNSEDNSDEVSDDKWVENDINHHKIGKAQLEWLVSKALVLPSDYKVLFMWHTPIDGAFGTNTGLINSDNLKTIIRNFKNGSSQNIADDDFSINLDFTSQGAREIIGIINGHLHKDSVDTDTIPGVTMIELANAACFWDFWNSTNADKNRKYGTDTEASFNILSINTKTKNVGIKRFGAGISSNFSY